MAAPAPRPGDQAHGDICPCRARRNGSYRNRYGGLQLRLDDRHWYGLLTGPGRIRSVARIGYLEQIVGALEVSGDTATLRIKATEPANVGAMAVTVGPDEIILGVDTGDGVRELARLDGRYLSTEVAGGFTGRVLGVTGPERPLRFAYTTDPEPPGRP